MDIEKKPRCPQCETIGGVTRHSRITRPDGTKYSRWLCRNCGITFIRRADRRRRGNYRAFWGF